MDEDVEIEPLNPEEEHELHITSLLFLNLEQSADVIAEIINWEDPNTPFELGWRNATIKMRAGVWKALFERELLSSR